MSNSLLHSLSVAARTLSVSTVTVRRLVATGALRAVHVGARVLVPDAELKRASRFGVGKPRTPRGHRPTSRR